MQAAVPGCFVKRRWGRGPQKSPPETFVRGLAVPPCSTPVTMPKKDPKKLCAFWGLISVPVVGVEPTRCHHQRILSPSRLPIPTHRLICCLYSILQACQKIKIYFALIFTAIPHNSKCRYGERGAADAKPKAQIILDAAKASAASGGNSEPKQGQRSQSARGFCPPKHDAGTATRHYRAFWQRRCRAAAAGAVLKPSGGNCAVLPYASNTLKIHP